MINNNNYIDNAIKVTITLASGFHLFYLLIYFLNNTCLIQILLFLLL
jgi:hypothetical protein